MRNLVLSIAAAVLGFMTAITGLAADPIWIDREAVRYQLVNYLEANPEIADKVNVVLEHLEGIEIVPGNALTNIYPRFDADFALQLANPDQIANWRVYEMSVPKLSHFVLYGDDGIIHLLQLPEMGRWRIKANLPMMADTVDLNHLEINFVADQAKLQAGVMGNWLKIVAEARIRGVRLYQIGVDLWESFLNSLGLGLDRI